ncbi:PTS sugar transporter subunit IIA [Anaerorhabdus furcosa]|uniref:PTS system, galactitol-specific IIA component n=1 Tax=Anaerorhabdus furcosa TaxID=118967 RepID=A0A1T4MFC3_9FIRM|nr:PTS sugar transporter subunit IIA [Anaerorhabdus furcosa]SJZ65729.1 PTS system, galactitol-specific IIA component [Anaerorhabdus furcosa]
MGILSESINEDLVILDIDEQDKEKVLQILANKMQEMGIVKETYLEGVLNREEIYPTGLLLGNYNVAIPHTESKHVNKNAIAIAKLNRPVKFKYMADPKMEIEVNLIFMLAISEPKNQVPVLSLLMNILSNQDNVSALARARNKEEFLQILKEKEVECI